MPSANSSSRLGYDTRSLRSALVMGAVDLLNPFKSAREFRWAGPCIVSSIAGLGDLFIHLPLISGIVEECGRRGIEVRVALRPAHIAIGEQCGWEVVPFDDALVDVFKSPEKIRPNELVNRIRELRHRPARLWIDLTGNAVSALAIKLTGTGSLAARATRGGRSLIEHPLPHLIQENEYGNVRQVAAYLGCGIDENIYERLRGASVAGAEGAIVLSLTTACLWKNWPLENFLALIDRFPSLRFATVGVSKEALPAEQARLLAIRQRPNVLDLVDALSVMELIRLIAHSSAMVTNDTSSAHIANGFRKPGAVLFGPVSPATFASPDGLRIFHDSSCPHHPCVQWSCARPEQWCMRKIKVEEVADYLATLAAFR